MGIRDFQEYIEAHCQQACKAVDLVILGRQRALGSAFRPAGPLDRPGPLRIVVDAESCLHKFYGGYYSDWACGGQWNRMLGFLQNLTTCCRNNNVELIVFFNGSVESQRINDWYQQQNERYNNALGIVKHLYQKGTPPPKAWWIPPAMTATCLRLALRQMGITVMCSMDDHHHEVITYCRSQVLDGIIAQDSDYLIFGPPRYFSAGRLKLKYSGSLETYEYVIDDIARMMDLHPNRFCLLAALLGTHIVSEHELTSFYCTLTKLSTAEQVMQYPRTQLIKLVIDFVRSLPSVDDLNAICSAVFGSTIVAGDDRSIRFKQSVQYYYSATKDGFIKSQQTTIQDKSNVGQLVGKQPGSYPGNSSNRHHAYNNTANQVSREQSNHSDNIAGKAGDPLSQKMGALSINTGSQRPGVSGCASAKSCNNAPGSTPLLSPSVDVSELSAQVLNTASSRHQCGSMHPWIYQILTRREIKLEVGLEDETNPELPLSADLYRPLRQHVYSILFDLSPKLEEWRKKGMISGTSLQHKSENQQEMAGGPLSESHAHRPSVSVKEWSIPRGGGARLGDRPRCDIIGAEPFEWGVPGLEKLWMGTSTEDKNFRLKSFMACMRCDSPQNMILNTSYVQQQHILFCSVIRYILTCKKWCVLRPHELDALLATAVSPLLQQVDQVQEYTLSGVKMRGVHLASLIMKGVEHAIFVNDAVGAPIPWGYACPWLFFDGKVFHMKLNQAENNATLLELCDGSYEKMLCVENMRTAILNSIQGDVFGMGFVNRQSQSSDWPQPHKAGYPTDVSVIPAGALRQPAPGHAGARMPGPGQVPFNGSGDCMMGRGHMGVSDSRGGRLEVAGVVVGNWGANASLRGGMGRGGPQSFMQRYPSNAGPSLPPHVMSIGPANRGGSMIRPGRGGGEFRGRGANEVNYRQNYSNRKTPTASTIPNQQSGKMTQGRGDTMKSNNGSGRGLTIDFNDTQ